MSNINKVVECSNDFVNQFSGYLPVVIAVFLAYIAYQQMRINKNKLKLDLYNQRFEVYASALQFYQEVISAECTKKEHRDFINKKESAYFLFSNNKYIYSILNEMHTKSFIINGFRNTAEQLNSSPEVFLKAQKESEEALQWFEKVLDKLRDEMNTYLNFK